MAPNPHNQKIRVYIQCLLISPLFLPWYILPPAYRNAPPGCPKGISCTHVTTDCLLPLSKKPDPLSFFLTYFKTSFLLIRNSRHLTGALTTLLKANAGFPWLKCQHFSLLPDVSNPLLASAFIFPHCKVMLSDLKYRQIIIEPHLSARHGTSY